ncbi:formate/nitrite transporter family protein [Roseiconus nitratireducens]|uniref:Formate/nitrite transporter family protein n=1 Tax=Roseiconus nitratireducens TaxID=2605748 RepID=A0A5M6D831_9BACT|nr:formate/nitrite transporter family protein [Roseiconus nitratireducens]KAA5543708.1 formate/nitrite transporter family protein [Roseiconus nitratireducens]
MNNQSDEPSASDVFTEGISGGEVSHSDEPKKPSQEIMRQELKEALAAFDRSTSRLFFSGLAAGLEIGFSLFLIAVMRTLSGEGLPPAIHALLIATMYSFGFILVILGRSELFTEQTSLAVLPVLSRRASFKGLLRLWTVVYVANLIGAAASAGLITYIGPALGVIDRQVFGEIASDVVHYPPQVILVSGVLAGWLMGLLSWLVAAGRETVSQILIIWLVTATIGLGHLHHSIVGSVELFAGIFSGGGTTLADFAYFLVWTTLGNAIGGPFFLALLKYTHARPLDRHESHGRRNQ